MPQDAGLSERTVDEVEDDVSHAVYGNRLPGQIVGFAAAALDASAPTPIATSTSVNAWRRHNCFLLRCCRILPPCLPAPQTCAGSNNPPTSASVSALPPARPRPNALARDILARPSGPIGKEESEWRVPYLGSRKTTGRGPSRRPCRARFGLERRKQHSPRQEDAARGRQAGR